MKKYLVVFPLMLLFFISNACKSSKSTQKAEVVTEHPSFEFKPLSKEVQTNFLNKKLASNALVDPGYWTWGLSVVQWTDGKYHAYYSRWKYEFGFNAWLTDCEIAHAVSDTPEGPYIFKNVVLESRNKAGWEFATAHNPNVCVANGKLYLYYISTDLEGVYDGDREGQSVSKWIASNWSIARNRQRIGLATASNPDDTFTRISKPVVVPQEGVFKNIAVNPAVIFSKGKFTMIMKGDDIGHEKDFRIQLAGHSKSGEGPFEFEKKPVYDQAQTEDATLWYDQKLKQYFMVCHVIGKPNLLLLSSKDSYQWKSEESSVFTKKEILLDNGEIWKPERMERPFVLTDKKGQPIMLFVAIKDKGVSGNIAIPIKKK